MLPDSLPYLPVKEQKERLGGCPIRQTAARMAGLLSEAKTPEFPGTPALAGGVEFGSRVFCPGRISFLSGSEAIVQGNFMSSVSRYGLDWPCLGPLMPS